MDWKKFEELSSSEEREAYLCDVSSMVFTLHNAQADNQLNSPPAKTFRRMCNYSMLLARVALDAAFTPPFRINTDPGTLSEQPSFKTGTFITLSNEDRCLSALELNELDSQLPVIGLKTQLVDKLTQAAEKLYPIDPDFESIGYKVKVTKGCIERSLKYLKETLNSYAISDPNSYRYDWASRNISIFEELKDFIGQTVFVSIDRCWDDGTFELLVEASGASNENNWLDNMYIIDSK